MTDKLKRLHEAATPGPWDLVAHTWAECSICSHNRTIVFSSIEGEATEDNQEQLEQRQAAELNLIVYLRNHAADFIALIEAAKAVSESRDWEATKMLNDALKPFAGE